MINVDEVARQLTAGAEAIRALVQAMPDDQSRWKPSPETWSMQEVMQHLYNEERRDFRYLLTLMLSDPPQPWAERGRAEKIQVEDCRQALDGFLAERAASTAWLAELKAPDWDRVMKMPWGTLGAGEVLVSWVEHDFLHMRQMVELLHAANVRASAPYSVQYAGGW